MINADSESIKQILYTEPFMKSYKSYYQDMKHKNIKPNILTEKKFTIKDADASYRIINHWSSLGLIDDVRSESYAGWRKFNLVDLVWLKALFEFREFGLPLERIKKGYEQLNQNEMIFEFGVYLGLLRKPIYLLIFNDGAMYIATRHTLIMNESNTSFSAPSYLIINLNNCIKQVLPNQDLTPNDFTSEFKKDLLNESEKMFLNELRKADYDEMTIKFTNGKADRIDMTKRHLGEIDKLADILGKVSYGSFKIQKQKGKICFIECTEKKKL